jgi:hypothetical protein
MKDLWFWCLASALGAGTRLVDFFKMVESGQAIVKMVR